MFTPIVAIFAIAIILGLYFIVKAKNKSDKKDHEADQGAGSSKMGRNQAP